MRSPYQRTGGGFTLRYASSIRNSMSRGLAESVPCLTPMPYACGTARGCTSSGIRIRTLARLESSMI